MIYENLINLSRNVTDEFSSITSLNMIDENLIKLSRIIIDEHVISQQKF